MGTEFIERAINEDSGFLAEGIFVHPREKLQSMGGSDHFNEFPYWVTTNDDELPKGFESDDQVAYDFGIDFF